MPEFANVSEYTQKDLLAYILCLLLLPDHAQHHMPDQILVFIHKDSIGMGIPIPYLIHQHGVVHHVICRCRL
jgi:hypothetical protein